MTVFKKVFNYVFSYWEGCKAQTWRPEEEALWKSVLSFHHVDRSPKIELSSSGPEGRIFAR